MAEDIQKVEEANFRTEIEKGVVLIDFYADWCGPCRMLTPVLQKVSQEVEGKARVLKLDIDKAQKTAATFQVTSVPTLILFKNGKEVGRLVGLRDAETVKQFVLTT